MTLSHTERTNHWQVFGLMSTIAMRNLLPAVASQFLAKPVLQ
jgi:hypothetical protein